MIALSDEEKLRWQARWARWRHLVAVASFGAGLLSFFWFERQERVAQALVVLLPLSWLLALIEPQLKAWAERRGKATAAPLLFGYAAQALHQECLFFTLPFFFATTAWLSPQLLFTALIALLALVSIIDPVYYRSVAPRRAVLWSFHAVAGFVTVLTAAPMLWHLTTTESLWLALVCLAAVSVPAWHAALPRVIPLRAVFALFMAVCLAWAGWQLRTAIPPATLWVSDLRMTASIDIAGRSAGDEIKVISADALHANGLYAWSSIHVPRGLREKVEHHWLHKGRLVDAIPLEVQGGREAGYRAWSHKQAFPPEVQGRWDVRVVTQSGQLIGQTAFYVK
ncbi:MAG TPA: DUF5924 family protein [Fontimonas sp.]